MLSDEERSLLIRAAAACQLLIETLEKLPRDRVASDRFLAELRTVFEKTEAHLESAFGTDISE